MDRKAWGLIMTLLTDKFVNDFFDAHEIDKAITRKELNLSDGVTMLSDMLSYVRKDVSTLDESAYDKLKIMIAELNKKNMERKSFIKKSTPEPEDTVEESVLKRKLLNEDHKRYQQELFFIQDIAYSKGWFGERGK
jgi:polyhydroxyalkanoate synthesis regulator phasin